MEPAVVAFKIALVVVLSGPDKDTIIYPFGDWKACKAKEEQVLAVARRTGDEELVVGCRRDVRLSFSTSHTR
jgi:hypothetical protein